MPPLSVLDLAPIVAGATAADAFRNTLDLARHAERLGYRRYWLAEHHNMPGIASAATAVVIGFVAGRSSSPSSSARSNRSIPGASTSASGARPAPTRTRRARSGAAPSSTPTVFRTM